MKPALIRCVFAIATATVPITAAIGQSDQDLSGDGARLTIVSATFQNGFSSRHIRIAPFYQ